MSDTVPVPLRGPIDLIAAIPHLVGYQPADGDVVVLGLRAATVVMTACNHLGDLPTDQERRAAINDIGGPVSHANIDSAAVVGYGDPEQIGASVARLSTFLTLHDIAVVEAICVAQGRYYAQEPATPDAEDGVPFDATTTAVAATMVLAGSTALPNRQALINQFQPVTGEERAAMHAATLRAWHRLLHITAGADNPGGIVENAGREAAAIAYKRHNNGDRIPDDEAAWLTVLLNHLTVRDYVLCRTYGHDGHLSLWTDLTRRAEPGLAAAPATLLAFTAWRMGNGSVANIALDRAFDAEPGYGMARLLAATLVSGVPPHGIADAIAFADDPLTERPTAC